MKFTRHLKFKRSAKANGENLYIVLNLLHILFRRTRVKIKSLTPELAFCRVMKFYFALFLLKIYNLIQNLYTLRYYLIFNFAAHSSSG